MPQLPLYKLQIDLTQDIEGMDYIALVDYPAHGKAYAAFNKQAKGTPEKVEFKQHFDEDKRIVTGVAIATNLPIYRRDHTGFEYNVVFTKKDTLDIAQQLFKNGYMHNVNEMHEMNKTISDIFLFESYFINDDKSNIPAMFEGQNLQPGSWITSYKVEDDDIWAKIKNGEFAGFSIEGWFKEVPIKTKKNSKMKKRPSLMERLFGKTEKKPVFDSANKDKYGTATTVSGDVVMWEGELEAGVPLFVEVEGEEPILAPAGDHTIDMDGEMIVLTVDEGGIITDMQTAEAQEEEEEEMATVEEVLEAMKAQEQKHKTELTDQKKAFEEQLKTVAEAFDQFKKDTEEAIEEALKKNPSKTKPEKKKGWKSLTNS